MKKFFSLISFSIFFNCTAIIAQTLDAERIYNKVNDAIVTIYTYDLKGQQIGQASGVILNEKGILATNYHVFAGAKALAIKHKDKFYVHSDFFAVDVEKDILILQISDTTKDKTNKPFPYIAIGNSDSLKVGQKIYAIGSPLGFENTITEGIISGLRSYEITSISAKDRTKDYIQISAPISTGSSGGAVVNAKGELIGISTFILLRAQNMNFAIPVNDVLKVTKKKDFNQDKLNAANYIYQRSQALYQGTYDKAILYFNKALKLDSQYIEAYYNLGSVYYYKEDYDSAKYYYKKTIQISPKLIEAYYSLGLVYNLLSNFNDAIINFKKVIEISSHYTPVYYNLASAYYQKGDYENAILNYKKGIQLKPQDANSYRDLATTYTMLENYEKAIYYYQQAITYNPNDALSYYNLGKTYYKKGDYDHSVNAIKQAINLNIELTEAYVDAAQQYYDYANQMQKGSKEAFLTLGQIYLDKMDLDAAIRVYKKAKEFFPYSAKIYNSLAKVYEMKGHHKIAKQYKKMAKTVGSGSTK